MRQEMSKVSEKGPRKLDKNAYKDLIDEQTEQHTNNIQNSGN